MKRNQAAEPIQEERAYSRAYKVLLYGLFFVFFAQLAALIYFNLTQIAAHSGFDSSWAYLKTALIWQDKTIYNPAWAETTGLGLDSPTLPAALIYGLTGNVFLSYGIANTLILGCILLCIRSICRMLKLSGISMMFILNLVICPFLLRDFALANDLSYFGNLLGGAAHYSVRILTILLITRQFLFFRQKDRFCVCGILAFPLVFLAGASSGIYMFMMLLFPYLAFEIEQVCLTNKVKTLVKKEAVYCYLCILFMFAGRLFATHVIGFPAGDHKTWTSFPQLWQNFGAVIQGFFKLVNALPWHSEEPILVPGGFIRVFPLFLLPVMAVSMIAAGRAIWKDWLTQHGFLLFCFNVVVLNILTFSLFNVQYGSLVFEERYLVSTFLFVVFMTGWFVGTLPAKKVISVGLCAAMLFSVAVIDVTSDFTYLEKHVNMEELDHVVSLAERENAGIVYSIGDRPRILSRNMRAYDLDHIYKTIADDGHGFIHWGDYTIADDPAEYSGPTLLVIVEADEESVPGWVLEPYEPLERYNGLLILKCERNPSFTPPD